VSLHILTSDTFRGKIYGFFSFDVDDDADDDGDD
jgi:hypothetical protein